MVLLGAGDGDMRRALEAARTQLAARGIDLEGIDLEQPPDRTLARTLTRERSARGVFWFDRSDSGEIGVFLAAADGSTFVRRVPTIEHGTEASLEAVFLIVEHSSVALAAGSRVAMESLVDDASMPEAPEPAEEGASIEVPPPADPPTTGQADRRMRVGITGAYRGESFASSLPWQSGAAIGAHLDLGRLLRLGLDYGFVAPLATRPAPVTWRHGPSLQVGVRLLETERIELSTRLVASLDLVHWRATDSNARGLRPVGVIGPDAVLRLRLVRDAFFELAPGVGVVVNRFAFVECDATTTRCDGDSRRPILEPWRFRPRLHAAIGYRF